MSVGLSKMSETVTAKHISWEALIYLGAKSISGPGNGFGCYKVKTRGRDDYVAAYNGTVIHFSLKRLHTGGFIYLSLPLENVIFTCPTCAIAKDAALEGRDWVVPVKKETR